MSCVTRFDCGAAAALRSDTNGCVAYLRVSSKRQLDGAGLRDQWRACVQHAQRLDLPLVGLYVDPAISGRKELRPALDQLKRDVQRRRFGTVIFYKVNRIGRNARASYQTAEEVERAGAIVASATETFNRRTAAGNLTFGMLVAVAQFGSDQLGEVMTDTLRAKAERGEWVGPVPLGYTRAGKTLVPSPDAEAIKLIGQLYCSGTHTHASIADALDAAGWQAMDWRTGERRRFGRESIRVILHNAAYIGKVSCGDQLYDGQHPPLWDQAAWDTIQRLHRERSEKVGRTSVKLPKRQLLLIEIAHCATCGKRMWGHGNGYRCCGRDQRTCQAPMVAPSFVDATALTLLEALTLPEDWRADVLAAAKSLIAEETPATSTITPEQIRTQLKRLALVWTQGDLDDATYQRERKRLQERLAELEQTAQKTVTPWELERAVDLVCSLGDAARNASPSEQAALLRNCFSHVWIAERRIQAVTLTRVLAPLMGALHASDLSLGWLTGLSRPTLPHPASSFRPGARCVSRGRKRSDRCFPLPLHVVAHARWRNAGLHSALGSGNTRSGRLLRSVTCARISSLTRGLSAIHQRLNAQFLHKACFKPALQFRLRQPEPVVRTKPVARVVMTHSHRLLTDTPRPPANRAAPPCRSTPTDCVLYALLA